MFRAWRRTCSAWVVKDFAWNDQKNVELKRSRGLTFEEIIYHIHHGGLLDIVEHSNQRRYPGQRMFIVRVGNYAYLIPFVETDNAFFLKTIIPSRRATRKYVAKVVNNE